MQVFKKGKEMTSRIRWVSQAGTSNRREYALTEPLIRLDRGGSFARLTPFTGVSNPMSAIGEVMEACPFTVRGEEMLSKLMNSVPGIEEVIVWKTYVILATKSPAFDWTDIEEAIIETLKEAFPESKRGSVVIEKISPGTGDVCGDSTLADSTIEDVPTSPDDLDDILPHFPE